MRIARGGLRTGRDEVILVLVMAIVGCSSSGAPSGPSNDAGGRDVLTGARDAGAESALDAPADAPRGEASVEAGADSSAPSCGVPFALTGPWCTKLPASTPLASNSAAVVANIQEDIKNNYGTFSINTDSYSTPIFTVPPGTATTNWTFDDCQDKGSLPSNFAPVLQNVPTTSGMLPSMGTDSEITIYDPSADQEWEFWVASQTSGQWSACWGGTIHPVSTNPGIFPSGLGATASGLPLLGFVTRIAELESGLIQHTINICVVRTQATNFSWPANRTDGNTADPDVLMEGQRVRLDPTFDVSTLPNAAERTFAQAMQDYGMILTDTSGAVDLQAEDDRPYMAAHGTTTSPYVAIFGGRQAYEVLADIPLDRLQVLPQNYGMP
jgi:hypothetical protein